jgi:hypothetical protein
MIWLYERRNEQLRLETRFDNATGEFVLVQHQSNGTQETERFPSEEAFRVRLTALSAALEQERWNPKGPPVILSDGWKI